MRSLLSSILGIGIATTLAGAGPARAQGAPDVVWEVATPSGLANSIQGVAWAPGGESVALGSTDRWLRTRRSADGGLEDSILQPHRSGSAQQTLYSADGVYLGVHNSSGGLGFRVHRASDATFLGTMTAALDAVGLIRFAPDAQLLAAVGGDGTLSKWRFAEYTVFRTVGSGYDKVTTVFNFAPNGALQTAATGGKITLQRRSDGSIVRVIDGGPAVVFSPDSKLLAAWSANPNEIAISRLSDGASVVRLATPSAIEGVTSLRFTRDGRRIVSTGYAPFVGPDGGWQQKGVIRFWSLPDGGIVRTYDQRTSLGVTSPVAWSPDGTRFLYGTYEGSAVVARTPP